jgi:hypothetical protein
MISKIRDWVADLDVDWSFVGAIVVVLIVGSLVVWGIVSLVHYFGSLEYVKAEVQAEVADKRYVPEDTHLEYDSINKHWRTDTDPEEWHTYIKYDELSFDYDDEDFYHTHKKGDFIRMIEVSVYEPGKKIPVNHYLEFP